MNQKRNLIQQLAVEFTKLYLKCKAISKDTQKTSEYINIVRDLNKIKYKIFQISPHSGNIVTSTIVDIDWDPYIKQVVYIDNQDQRFYTNPNELFLTKAADMHKEYLTKQEELKKTRDKLKLIFLTINKEYPSTQSKKMLHQLRMIPKVLIPKKTSGDHSITNQTQANEK